MTKVHLLGKAGEKFGKEFNLKKNLKQVTESYCCTKKRILQLFL